MAEIALLIAIESELIIADAEAATAAAEGAVSIAQGSVSIAQGAIADAEGAENIALSSIAVEEGAVAVEEGAITIEEGAIADAEGASIILTLQEMQISLQKLQGSAIKNGMKSLKQLFSSRKIGMAVAAIIAAAEIEGGGARDAVNQGFKDMIELIQYTFEFIKTHMVCGVYFAKNIRECVFYYIIDAILLILYLPIRIFKWVFRLITGSSLMQDIEDQIWSLMEQFDTIWFTITKFHLIYWPKQIRDDCYNCKRLKVMVLAQKAEDVAYDFGYNIPTMALRGVEKLFKGAHSLVNPLDIVSNDFNKLKENIDLNERDMLNMVMDYLNPFGGFSI